MDAKGKIFFSILLYFCLVAGAVVLYFNTASNRTVALALFAVFALLSILQNRQYLKAAGPWRWGRLFILLKFGLALAMQYFDHSTFSGFGVMIVISTVLVTEKVGFCAVFTAIAMAATIAMHYLLLHHSIGYPVQSIGTIVLPRTFMVAALAVARFNSVISERNRQLTLLLREKTAELEISLCQLKAYAEDLKETADLRARDRLMRDLHDTLGHTLATASISAQAVAVLIDQDTSAAKARLGTVTQQIQAALKSLRDVLSGKTIDYSEDELTSAQFLHLLRETEKSTEISIHLNRFDAEAYDALPVAHRSFLYNALMEGLTNGIRHGGATGFEVSLSQSDGMIHFTLKDNGKGFGELSFGYGLSKISRDARRLGGQLHITNLNGCEMRIELPVEDGKEPEGSIHG